MLPIGALMRELFILVVEQTIDADLLLGAHPLMLKFAF